MTAVQHYEGLVALARNRHHLPQGGAIYMPRHAAVDLFDCTLWVVNAAQSRNEIRVGAYYVPQLLRDMDCRHWLQIDTFLDLTRALPVTESDLRHIFQITI